MRTLAVVGTPRDLNELAETVRRERLAAEELAREDERRASEAREMLRLAQRQKDEVVLRFRDWAAANDVLTDDGRRPSEEKPPPRSHPRRRIGWFKSEPSWTASPIVDRWTVVERREVEPFTDLKMGGGNLGYTISLVVDEYGQIEGLDRFKLEEIERAIAERVADFPGFPFPDPR